MRNLLVFMGLPLAVAAIGCSQTRPPVTFPPGTLPVRYEASTRHTTCLVASVAMAANYLLGERVYTEANIAQALKNEGKDETSTADLKAYLESKGLYLLTLSGQMDGKPPTSIRYWVQTRRYPVICVINSQENDPRFNHAVVVTGIGPKSETELSDTVHYLDPSDGQPLHSVPVAEFETLWARGQHAMMIVVAPPREAASGPAGN